jgi:hypothetical protein
LQGGGGLDAAFGAFGPDGAFGDPAFDGGDLFGGDLVAFGRHGFGVGAGQDEDFVEGAFFGVAGNDDGAAGTGCEGGRFVLDFEIAHERAIVVAVDAMFFQDRTHVGGEVEFWRGGYLRHGFASCDQAGESEGEAKRLKRAEREVHRTS